MHPVLFKISAFEARSYYVLWAFALFMFLYAAYKRCIKKGVKAELASSVLLWVYCGGILGAIFGAAAEKLPLIISGKADRSILLAGGSSACFGILSGGLAGIYRLRGEKLPIGMFADACALPISAMLAVGRAGCLLEGCCRGKIVEKSCCAIHFPQDLPGVYRFPSQIAEAAAAGIIFLILLAAEKKYAKNHSGGLLFALFLIMYGGYRLVFDIFREKPQNDAFNSAVILSLLAVVAGVSWLYRVVTAKTVKK